MKVGEPVPALNPVNDSRPLKMVYQEFADTILERINVLIDPQDFLQVPSKSEYRLRIFVGDDKREMQIQGQDVLAHFLHAPVLLRSLLINLKQPVKTLFPEDQPRTLQEFILALRSVLAILRDNSGFLTYRMGMEKGKQAEQAIQSLVNLLEDARVVGEPVRLEASAHHSYLDGRIEEKISQYDLEISPLGLA